MAAAAGSGGVAAREGRRWLGATGRTHCTALFPSFVSALKKLSPITASGETSNSHHLEDCVQVPSRGFWTGLAPTASSLRHYYNQQRLKGRQQWQVVPLRSHTRLFMTRTGHQTEDYVREEEEGNNVYWESDDEELESDDEHSGSDEESDDDWDEDWDDDGDNWDNEDEDSEEEHDGDSDEEVIRHKHDEQSMLAISLH